MTRTKLKCLVLISCVSGLTHGCGTKHPQTSDFKFDSAHNIGVDGVINSGRILTSSSNPVTVKSQIRQQLNYIIGQMNGINGGIDMGQLEITVGAMLPLEGRLLDAAYTASLFLSWPREMPIPQRDTFIVPSRGDQAGLREFFSRYGADERSDKKCMAAEASDVSMDHFWYYYRPLKVGCPLEVPSSSDPMQIRRIPVELRRSDRNTSGKSPEYGKVWEDGKLVATVIFSKFEESATTNIDAGISAYIDMYWALLRTYGEPILNSLPLGEEPSAKNDVINLSFNTLAGPLELAMFLVGNISSVNEQFTARFNELTKVSDYVGYSGHSGLGANIRALSRMGTFVRGKYQLYLLNGCDSLAYVDGSLRDAHYRVNPEAGPDKFFDLITNATPSYFHMNATSNMAVIDALLGQRQSYREILASFDIAQRASVSGEEDNLWPQPF